MEPGAAGAPPSVPRAGTACILAGGRGTRLRAVLSDRPKPLAPVGGRPFVARLIERVAAAGWRPIVLLTGHMAGAVEAALGTGLAGVELRYSREPEPLGTAGAVRLALPTIDAGTIDEGPVLVLNGDSWADVDLVAQLAVHRERDASATLALVEVEDAGRYGSVDIGPDGWIEGFREKAADVGGGLINAGIYVLERKVIEAIPTGRAVSMERDVFPALVGRGLLGHVSAGRFIDIGTPESLARAERFFLQEDG